MGLWGMTGTGKSSLVRALVENLGLAGHTFWLDAGECRRYNWLNDTLDQIRMHHDGDPFILVIDEFQHARTLKDGVEMEEPAELRRLWELIDVGRVMLEPGHQFGLRILLDLEHKQRTLLMQGVVIAHGRVVQGWDIYERVMGTHGHGEPWAIPRALWEEVRDMMPRPISMCAFQELLESCDNEGVLELLRDLLALHTAPIPVDASKALVLVMGNLDELYTGGRDLLPELDPEVLLDRSRDIGRTGIHEALSALFRIEQVARLGIDHIVFPPLGSDTVKALVKAEAEGILARLTISLGFPLTVSQALLDMIRQGSSIPVLGARPVVATVHRVLPSLAAQIQDRLGLNKADSCTIDIVEGRAIAHMEIAGRTVVAPLKWPIERPPLPDPEALRRYATHEAGHLLCGVRLAGLKPLQVCARTSSARLGGFVIWKNKPGKPFTRSQVVPRLAGILGGWVAERIVYGEQGVSTGSDDDLRKATAMALDLVKEHGFGQDRFFHAEHATASSVGFRTMLGATEEQARQCLQEAEELALRTIVAERELLERIIEALVGNGSIGPKAIDLILAGESEPIKRIGASRSEGDAVPLRRTMPWEA